MLIVDSHNELQEAPRSALSSQPKSIRVAANLISYIFHPLFIPVYICLFLLAINPFLFGRTTIAGKIITLVRFTVFYSFFPLVTVLLLHALGFLQSLHMRSQKDRIIPYVACGIYYFWAWYVFRNLPEIADEVVMLTLAIWIAASLGLLANIAMKVSMHAMSMGVMITYMALFGIAQGQGFGIYLSIALLVAGVVCTARLIVSDHTQFEVYGGLFIGVLSQLIAAWAY